MRAYYFSSENFPASTIIIPVTLIILDREQFVFLGGVQSSARFRSRTTAFKRSD